MFFLPVIFLSKDTVFYDMNLYFCRKIRNMLIECVPNFSEGRNMATLRQIGGAIASVEGVRLLHVDAGQAANRTVFTFTGRPDAVSEAAFRGACTAAELIDMRLHHGTHPRIGAMDVCPLIPLTGISLEETAVYARALARRVGDKLAIPVYCYEAAAFAPHRRSLAACRQGEYEGLPAKLAASEWAPDFGPNIFNPRSGAAIIGARNILIAWNINLNTDSIEVAKKIAADIRESGQTVRDASGGAVRRPGMLPKVRAIGWYIAEYGCAQVSMNLLDYHRMPLHIVWEAVCRQAERYGVKVTGSELVGLIPLDALTEVGAYFAVKQGTGIRPSSEEALDIAVNTLGLNQLAPFIPQERILEYLNKP